MGLPGPIHDSLLVFLGSGLILGSLGVVLLPILFHATHVLITTYFDNS